MMAKTREAQMQYIVEALIVATNMGNLSACRALALKLQALLDGKEAPGLNPLELSRHSFNQIAFGWEGKERELLRALGCLITHCEERERNNG